MKNFAVIASPPKAGEAIPPPLCGGGTISQHRHSEATEWPKNLEILRGLRPLRMTQGVRLLRPPAAASQRLAKLLAMTGCLLILFIFSPSLYAQSTVKGRVVFEGTPPAVETVEVKSDVPTCGTTKEVSKVLLGKGQGVANAVVKVAGAPGAAPFKKGALDQMNCEFVPHVQVLPVGSTLNLTSSDAVLHNAHGFYEDGSTAFNLAVPIPGMEVAQKLNQPGVIKLRCDAGHTWMSAYVVVTNSPYFALTDSGGNFTIEGVPPGDYEIEVWHEWLGKYREPLQVKGTEAEPITIELRRRE